MSLVRFRPEAPTKQSPGRAPPFQATCECSSSGRAPPCQGGGSEFEPRHSLHFLEQLCSIRCHSQVVRQSSAKAPLPSSNLGGTSKTKGHPKGCPFVLGFDRRRRSPPFGISMLGVGKAAPAPRFSPAVKTLVRRTRARRPEGRVGAVLSACREFENIQIVVTSQKKRTSERMSFSFEFRSRPKGGSTLRDLNAQVGKAALPPRFSLSAKMLERRKSGAAQKGCWVIFKIADENLMYLYCHALLKRNTSRQAGVSFWAPLGFKLLIEINSRCSAVRKSTPTQQSAR